MEKIKGKQGGGGEGLRYLRQKAKKKKNNPTKTETNPTNHCIQKLRKGYKITSTAISASSNSMWKICKGKLWKSGKNNWIDLNHGTKWCKIRLPLYFRIELTKLVAQIMGKRHSPGGLGSLG